jgi:hypothetical protein
MIKRFLGHRQFCRTEMVAEKVETSLDPANEGLFSRFCCGA